MKDLQRAATIAVIVNDLHRALEGLDTIGVRGEITARLSHVIESLDPQAAFKGIQAPASSRAPTA